MGQEDKKITQLLEEIENLRIRLEEAEETISAIRSGEVDAIVVSGPQGEQVFTLTGAERAYRVLIETMTEGAVTLNQEGLIIFCNQRLAEMLKTPLERVIGVPMRQFIRESDLPQFDSLMETELHERSKGEVSLINSGGTLLPVLLSVSALQKDKANICGITVTDLTAQKHVEEELRRHRDNLEELVKERTSELEAANQRLQEEIAEREKTEKALRESESRFRQLTESLPQLVWTCLPDGRCDYLSRQWITFTGVPETQQFGSGWLEQVHPDDRALTVAAWETAVASGTGFRVEFRIRRHDGEYRWFDTRAVRLCDAEGHTVKWFGSNTDITEQKKLEIQLHQAQKMEAVGQLAGGIAHDFNNILSAIIGYGYVTLMKMAKDDPLRSNIEQMLAASDRAAELTKSILAFGRKQLLDRRPTELNGLIRKVEKYLNRVIGEDITIHLALCESGISALVDSGQLEQVLMNLATNSRDAMPKGGLLSIETFVTEQDDGFIREHGYGNVGKFAVISVSDSGTGMDEETKTRIFEPFFTTKEVGKGTGLGLSMVYGIIKQHDGYINVYSEPGKGTTFRIHLPLLESSENEEKIPVKAEFPEGGGETILFAEDDKQLREFTSSILQEFGYTVIVAVDGEDAVKKFTENSESVRLLLFDLVMPKKSGKEAYDEIRQIEPDVRILFMSGYAPDIIRQKGLTENGTPIIAKPVSPVDLLKKIRSLLDG